MWYTGINLADARSLTDLFQRKYPFIKVQIHRASGTQIVSKIMVEKNAGKPQFDVASSGVLRVLKQQGVLQPYLSPEVTGFSPQYRDDRVLVRVRCPIFRRGLQPTNVGK